MIVVVESDRIIIDVQSVLDLIATGQYESKSKHIILDKRAADDEFFTLSSGLAKGAPKLSHKARHRCQIYCLKI